MAGTPFDLRAARRIGDVIYQVAGTVMHHHPFVKFSNRVAFFSNSFCNNSIYSSYIFTVDFACIFKIAQTSLSFLFLIANEYYNNTQMFIWDMGRA